MIKRLLSSTQGALVLSRLISQGAVSDAARQEAIALGAQDVNVNVRDLFERFLPPSERAKRLGDDFQPDEVLALQGNAEQGKQAFFYGAASQCKNCHVVHGSGGSLGPDLTEIGKKYADRNELFETLLNPSKKIEEKYASYVVATTNGQVYTGVLVAKTDKEVVLKDADSKEIHVPADEVDEINKQDKSIMPDNQLRDLTAQEAADLLEFLASLK
jgi:putative heme-binding domain-containing protein